MAARKGAEVVRSTPAWASRLPGKSEPPLTAGPGYVAAAVPPRGLVVEDGLEARSMHQAGRVLVHVEVVVEVPNEAPFVPLYSETLQIPWSCPV